MFHDETMPSFFRRPSFSPDGSLLLVPGRKFKDTKNQQKYLYVTKDTSVKAYKSYAVAKKFHSPFPLHHICVYGIKYLPCTLLFYYLSWLAAGRIDVGDQVVNTTYVFTRASPNKWVKIVSLHLVAVCVVNKTTNGLNHEPPYKWVSQNGRWKKNTGHRSP